MQKSQTIEFAVIKDSGRVATIGRSSILQPAITFNGGSVKWYEDKPRQKNN